MQITIAAATRLELKEDILKHTSKHNIDVLYTGVGILSSAVSLTKHVLQHKPDLIIQAGIAGAFYRRQLGEVVVVKRECIGDLGVRENGGWLDLFDMNLLQANEVPYHNRYLPNEHINRYNTLKLPLMCGITVNQISTEEETIHDMMTIYYADIESMEGASLHYVCKMFNIPFIQIRAISNYVGERDKSKWKIREAVINLNNCVAKMLQSIT